MVKRVKLQNTANHDAMMAAINAAWETDEVQELLDRGEIDKYQALELYTRIAQNTESERQACEIRLRAERAYKRLLREKRNAIKWLKENHPDVARRIEADYGHNDGGVTKKAKEIVNDEQTTEQPVKPVAVAKRRKRQPDFYEIWGLEKPPLRSEKNG